MEFHPMAILYDYNCKVVTLPEAWMRIPLVLLTLIELLVDLKVIFACLLTMARKGWKKQNRLYKGFLFSSPSCTDVHNEIYCSTLGPYHIALVSHCKYAPSQFHAMLNFCISFVKLCMTK